MSAGTDVLAATLQALRQAAARLDSTRVAIVGRLKTAAERLPSRG